MAKTKIFLDMEFTGLHKLTTPVSIALVSENGREYYAEFTDYDKLQVDDFIAQMVIKNLTLDEYVFERDYDPNAKSVLVKGDSDLIRQTLEKWLEQFKDDGVEIWGDVPTYDWVLFASIFGSALDIPSHVYYIPLDISTVMRTCGVDPDVNREEFAYNGAIPKEVDSGKHNALTDAKTMIECYKRLLEISTESKSSEETSGEDIETVETEEVD